VSFFDDDAPRATRTRRPADRRPNGRPRRPAPSRSAPADPDAIRRRQLVAAGLVLLFFVIVIVGVKACSTSAKKRHLRDYNDSVTAIAQKSDREVSKPLFSLLSGAGSAGSGKSVQLQNQVNGLKSEADQELKNAQALDVPSQADEAQRYVLLSLELRRDGTSVIADQLQPALSGTDNGTGARRIAGEMQAFTASDVIWSQRVIPLLANALRKNGVPVGGDSGEVVPTSRFLPDLAWLDQTYVSDKLGQAASGSTGHGKPKPGTHGHALQSVSVGSTTLSPTATNTVAVDPAPVFTVKIQNQGENDETNVRVRVQVGSITATKTVAKTTAGQTATADVSLPKAPPTSSVQTVKVTVPPVPGEGTTDNNTQSFPVQFTR
jgi:carbon monoxide dehydrogenase subunit G